MLARLIPVLLLTDDGLVKTTQFRSPKYIGDPINTVRIFCEKEADELVILDIDASRMQREPNYALLAAIASQALMPLSYGGGIFSLKIAEKILNIGFEKIILNTLLFNKIEIVKEMVRIFGSQSIVACLDIKMLMFGKYALYNHATKKNHKLKIEKTMDLLAEVGVGEIIIQNVNRDGTRKGFDIKLIHMVGHALKVPLIALGGCGDLEDAKAVLAAGADAVAAGSYFVFQGESRAVLITYPKYNSRKELSV